MNVPPLSAVLESGRGQGPVFHFGAACAWLDAGLPEKRPSHLVYAAFELRLAVESLALALLGLHRDGELTEKDLQQTRKSHSALVGYLLQMENIRAALGRKMRFHRIVMEITGDAYARAEFDAGKLSLWWDACAPALRPGFAGEGGWRDVDEAAQEYARLEGLRAELEKVLREYREGWTGFEHSRLKDFQKDFLRGKLKEDDLRMLVRDWAGTRPSRRQ